MDPNKRLRWEVGDTLNSNLGPMKIHKVLGGGKGVVYIVTNESAHSVSVYAAKTFQPQFLDSAEAVEGFKREATVWIELEAHPNVVRAYYVEEIEGQPFIFMQFIAGSDLREKLRERRPLEPTKTLKYAIHFCRGMLHAASRIPNFVHRDVKPENCMITVNDTLKVTDFGLAKSADASDAATVVPSSQNTHAGLTTFLRTRNGKICGTLPYMAPELLEGERIDHRVDIYAFGVMLFEMLTGRLPFDARLQHEWIYAHLKKQPPDPRRINPDCNPELAHLTLQCLAKDRNERPADFAQIHSHLENVLQRRFGMRIPRPAPRELSADDLVNKGTSLLSLIHI